MIEGSKPQTTPPVTADELAKMLEQKAVEFLEPVKVLMDAHDWASDAKKIMWRTIAIKANGYAARLL